MGSILVTGALGQVGSELTPALRERYGPDRVIATDVREAEGDDVPRPFRILDCTDREAVRATVRELGVDTVYHLAAILSAKGEKDPRRTYRTNVQSVLNVLDAARDAGSSVFIPSSIAAFGASTPRDPTPQETLQRPSTMYGITKVAGELLADYYHGRWRVDVRGLRFPGLISYAALPGGGTTDYAVEIFYGALREGGYTCFLRADAQLDFLYMPDAIRAAIELMEADGSGLRHRNAYNVTGMQLTPEDLAAAIRAHVPEFEITYEVDPARQAIADSWPRRVDDSAAREDWGWRPRYDLEEMTEEMLARLEERLARTDPAHR